MKFYSFTSPSVSWSPVFRRNNSVIVTAHRYQKKVQYMCIYSFLAGVVWLTAAVTDEPAAAQAATVIPPGAGKMTLLLMLVRSLLLRCCSL